MKKIFVILFLAFVNLSQASENYFVCDSGGTVGNVIVADAKFSLPGKTLIKVSLFPSGKVGDSIVKNSLIQADLIPETDDQKSVRIAAQADTIYTQQPIAAQAAFAPLYVAVKDAVALKRFDVAHDIVMGAEVPPELEGVRNQIADLLK